MFRLLFFGQNEFFVPVFRTSIAVIETFPISSNPSSHGPGRYVKHPMARFASIIKDQVSYLRSLGLKAAFVGESVEIDKRIIKGTAEMDILYGSREASSIFSIGAFFCSYTCLVSEVW